MLALAHISHEYPPGSWRLERKRATAVRSCRCRLYESQVQNGTGLYRHCGGMVSELLHELWDGSECKVLEEVSELGKGL